MSGDTWLLRLGEGLLVGGGRGAVKHPTNRTPTAEDVSQPKRPRCGELRSPRLPPGECGGCGHRGWVKGSLSSCFLRVQGNGSFKLGKQCGGTGRGPTGDRHAGGFTCPPHPFLGSQAHFPMGRSRRTSPALYGSDAGAAQGLDPQSQLPPQLTWKEPKSLNKNVLRERKKRQTKVQLVEYTRKLEQDAPFSGSEHHIL